MSVVVVGQVARDLVLRVDGLPDAGASAVVHERRELLGGKGANQAVGLRRRGLDVVLVGVVGDDGPGRAVRDQAAADGIDVTHVVCRAGATTALLVDVTDGRGERRLLEHVPAEVLLTAQDVEHAAEDLRRADTLVVQLQQPVAAALAAVRLAGPGTTVVLDGAPEQDADALLAAAHVVRADHAEAELLTGRALAGAQEVLQAGRELVARGPSLVALEAGREGNVLVWRDGEAVVPLTPVDAADPTGGGDAFVAALVDALGRGAHPVDAGRAATEAAGRVVERLGGRPVDGPVQPLRS